MINIIIVFLWTIVRNYVKGTSMPDALASDFFHTHSLGKEILGDSSPILDQVTLRDTGKKK